MRKHTILLALFLMPLYVFSISNNEEGYELIDKAYEVALSNPERASRYIQQAFDIAKSTSDSLLISSTLSTHGYICLLQGNFDLGVMKYYDALEYCPSDENSLQAKIRMNLGSLYASLKDYSKALELIDGSTSLYKALNDSAGVANAYNARGIVHIYMNENEIADKFFKDALRINKALGSEKNMAANINNLCLYEGNTEEKIMLLEEAIQINKRLNSTWSLAENYNNMGVQLYYGKRYKEAVEALKKASAYAIEINAKELICDNYRYFSWVYSAMKDYNRAYVNLLNLYEMETKLYQERRLVNIEREVADRKFLDQKKEAALKEQAHKIQLLRMNIMIVVASVVFLLLLIFFLVKHYKRKKNLQISEASSRLLEQEKIIMDLQLQQQAAKLEQQSQDLKTTQHELTNFVIFLNSRNELLEKIRSMIRESYKMEHGALIGHLKKINSFILQFKQAEEQENGLTKEINEKNELFLKKLEEIHPALTPGEKALATFLRINLSTKEISLLTGTSVKTVGMNRYRLRKSLNLDSKEDITAYLQGIS